MTNPVRPLSQSYGLPQMIIGRIVTGLGNGINVSELSVMYSHSHELTRFFLLQTST